jgi:hypothetical protein
VKWRCEVNAVMDEAFKPFEEIVAGMLSFNGEIVDEEAGVHSYIYRCEIESPVELNVFRDEDGKLRIGSTPPIYYVDTSFRPSYHRISFKAELSEETETDV